MQNRPQSFDKIARYKLFEMIDRNMMDNLTENVRLGKFSGLIRSSKSEAIVKELIGQEAFKRLCLLQTNAERLAKSAEKFYNASKSGTSLIDVGLASSAAVDVLTGNPFLVMKSVLQP